MTLTNCGGDDSPPVNLTLDGLVEPVGERSDFTIPVTDNSCHPINGDNEAVALPVGASCVFQVVFAPGVAGDHRAQTVFTSSAQSGVYTIDLFGNALGGTLEFAVPDLPEPQQIPEQLCVDYLVDQCTANRTINIANQGPGVITVADIRLEQNQGFELVDVPQVPLALAAGDSSAIRLRWCGPVLNAGQATMVVDSDDQAQPTFVLPLIRRAMGCEPDPTLVAAYGFEGTGTQVLDSTGNGYDGVLQSPAQRTQAGRFGAGVEFTGAGGHVDLGTELALSGNAMTIALWINADDFEIDQARFIAKATGRNEQQQYWQVGTAGNRIRFRVKTSAGGTTTLETDPTLEPNAWTHIAVTYDGSQMTIYKDGVPTTPAAKSGDLVVDPGIDVWIGDSPPDGTRSFDGRIDEIRIYNRALDAQEIQQIRDVALIPIPNNP
ncbi:MAG: LamG domain-containing protein [Planctomycetes bacterium]|nr:LamG domain-containing protein [Planctomycetota bacterium]